MPPTIKLAEAEKHENDHPPAPKTGERGTTSNILPRTLEWGPSFLETLIACTTREPTIEVARTARVDPILIFQISGFY